MTEQREPSSEEARAFLRDLVDHYGVQGLTDRLAAAIEEAEAGRVEGPALDEATSWLEQEQGPRIATFAGEGRLTLSASGGSASAGTAYLSLSGSGMLAAAATSTGDGVVHRAVEDVIAVTDQAAVTVTETAHVVVSTLPTNMQVIAQVQETFWYLINVWSLTQTPEVIPFALLLALAIVVTRIRVKQARG